MLQGAHHVGDEILAILVDHLGAGIACAQHVADGVDEVGLAQTGTTVNKQRIISLAGILRDLQAGGSGNLVGITLDESGKGEIRVERPALEQLVGVDGRPGGRLGRRCFLILSRRRLDLGGAAADFQQHFRRLFGSQLFQHGLDLCQMVFLDPVEHEAIRREQVQAAVVLSGMQRSNPGIQLRFR